MKRYVPHSPAERDAYSRGRRHMARDICQKIALLIANTPNDPHARAWLAFVRDLIVDTFPN